MRTLIVWMLGGLMLAGCGGDARETLVIYSPHGKEMLSQYEEAFERLHPEVNVQWIDMGGQDAYDRIRTERQNPQASLWWGGDGPMFDRAAREGLLEPYVPSWAEAVPDDAHHPAHFWYATYLTPEVIMFNSRTLAPEEAPKDWDDLLDPKWDDRIIVRYPLASSTMRTIWGAMIMRQPTVEEGYAWLARLDANTKTYAADPTQLYLKIAREEGDLTLWNMPDTYIQAEINGYPFDYVIPASGTPVLNDAIALVKNGPNLERAKQFYEFVTSDSALVEQARTYYRIPVRTDLDPARLPAWITRVTITPMPVDWERLATEGPAWMQYWDEHIKGRGEAWLREHGYAE
ncbi:extracellular solute-binding protein [Rhodocaloribacter litoris]|uniref:extracellular solute-binding protein n=1 Tax=Rhodocaloribacter litoris TaxID=2558931 RepID=UPI0014249D07|nr:extracellular solute-binding protein [Rhodocaloribacter litoris]QXD16665.1 extracellular solute-binding protein [Rhodocaloribacter litoris]